MSAKLTYFAIRGLGEVGGFGGLGGRQLRRRVGGPHQERAGHASPATRGTTATSSSIIAVPRREASLSLPHHHGSSARSLVVSPASSLFLGAKPRCLSLSLSLALPPPIPAQAIRIALHDLGVPYEEEYAARDVWPAMKKDRTEAGVLTFGQIPQWTAPDGVTTMVQSGAILRHLARTHGAYGSSEADMARVDVVMDGAADWRRAYTKLIYTDRLEAAAVAEYKAGPLPTWLGFFERLAAAGGGAGFIAVPAACTIADYALFDLIDTQRRVFPDLLDGGATPALAAWFHRMAARPRIAAYFASDPEHRKTANGNGLG
jgi:glutathione S-transferase